MSNTDCNYPRFLRLGRTVQAMYGISRSTQYRLIEQGKLRRPTQITPYLQGWLREDLEADLLGISPSDTPKN